MPRKVFISFLGTTNYHACTYKIDDTSLTEKPVRFVQEALIRYFCMGEKAWTEEDRVLIFCTHHSDINHRDGSYELNWLDNGHGDKAKTDLEKVGLQTILGTLRNEGLKPSVEMVQIESGFTEEQVWSIFNTVYSKLYEADKIYFDVTHAFRSIPIFSIVLFNHSKVLKNTTLEAIKYGAFEAPDAQGRVPVLDLTNIARLQTYNQLASDFKLFGKVGNIRQELGKDTGYVEDQAIRRLKEGVRLLDEYITTIQLSNLRKGEFVSNIKENIDRVKTRNDVPQPFKNILMELKDSMGEFNNGDSNVKAAINWACKYGMWIQAYALTEEYVISKVRGHEEVSREIPRQLPETKKRQFISSILALENEIIKGGGAEGQLTRFREEAKRISNMDIVKELRPYYRPLAATRNALAHGSGEIQYRQLQRNLIDYCNGCFKVLNNYSL